MKGKEEIIMERSCSNTSCSKESCEGCPSSQAGQGPESFLVEGNPFSSVKKVIGVVSGKGGVGKSLVTALLADKMASEGYRVGIMDADITGPSMPKMFGIHEVAGGDENGIYPAVTKNGIRLMSINLLMEDEEAPVIWRGPVIANVVKQFWSEVVWGELDYLFVDMPPGTGDVPLTVFQSLPVDGIVVVTSPQDLVRLIVKKAINMAEMMNIPLLVIFENYSYVKCPDCGKEIHIFGESHTAEAAAANGVKLLGRIPVDTSYALLADEGRFEEADTSYVSAAVEALA